MNNILMDHCLNSARGWVELGNCIEASRELDRMIPAWRTHPATLEVRWEIYARGKLWNAAFEMALAICELAPERIDGWVLQAESLFHRNQELRSRDLLISVIDRFPGRALIPFLLACYSHHLGFTEEVKEWVELAFTCGDFDQLAHRALREPAFEPVLVKVRERCGTVRRAELPGNPGSAGRIVFQQADLGVGTSIGAG
jgi:hypothetical protein